MDNVEATDLTPLLHDAARQIWPLNNAQPEHPRSYRLTFDQEPVQPGIVEFRTLLFLASRPYYAFTRRSIVAAVNSERDPILESNVDQHVTSLIDQLGVFHHFVQSVPNIGYCFRS
jgi:DNA-binding response OmpR family regulator